MLKNILKTHPKQLAIVVLLIFFIGTFYNFFNARKIKFDYNIENFFSSSDPDLKYYKEHRKRFENDNDFVLVGLRNENGVFKSKFLKKVDTLSILLEQIKNINYVLSPTNLKKSIISPLGTVFNQPIISITSPNKYTLEKNRIFSNNDFYRSFFSVDEKAITIYIKKLENTSIKVNNRLLNEIEKALEKAGFSQYHLAGRIKTQNYYINSMKKEMVLFGAISVVLLVLFLIVSFRNIWAIIAPFIVLGSSVLCTFSLMVLFQQNLDLMLTMLPTLLFVIGVSNCVHLISKYQYELKLKDNILSATKLTISETGFATLITSLTTAAGFFLLILIPIKPIQSFGFFVGLGVLITYLVSIIFFPCLFILLPKNIFLNYHHSRKPHFMELLEKVFLWITRNGKRTLGISFFVIIISFVGINKIRINNHFLDDLSKSSSLLNDLAFFEKHFAGIRPFEIGIEVVNKNKNILDLKILANLDKLENYLEKSYGVGAIFSPLSIVKMANQSINDGSPSHYKLPDNEENLSKLVNQLKTTGKLHQLSNIISKDKKYGRINGRVKDLGNISFEKLNTNLKIFIKNNIDPNLITIKLTGAAELMDKTNRSIAYNLTKGIVGALLFIAIIIGGLFKSAKMAIISLIPNILPLVVIGGIMGLFGIELKVGTALIFTIAFGIAVDDTVHLLSKLRFELNKGRGIIFALKNSICTCGRALILTTFILSSGFLIFLFSEFSSTFYIGLLICLALILALLADFFILPVLIILSRYERKK